MKSNESPIIVHHSAWPSDSNVDTPCRYTAVFDRELLSISGNTGTPRLTGAFEIACCFVWELQWLAAMLRATVVIVRLASMFH